MLNPTKINETGSSGLKFINQIMIKNQRTIDGQLWISKLLFQVLTEFEYHDQLNTRSINGNQFIQIASIPKEIRDELGLFWTETRERLVISEPTLGLPIQKTPIAERLAKSDVKAALRNEKRYRHEFIDHYHDLNTIKIKARTLSILRSIPKDEKTKEYFEAVYNVLVAWKVPCDFPLDNFKLFYEKYEWYIRTGFVPGLLNTNYNPNF